jgi:hypothetical protein
LLAKGRQIGDGTNDGGCRLRITQIARVDALNNCNSDTNRPLKKKSGFVVAEKRTGFQLPKKKMISQDGKREAGLQIGFNPE